MAQEVGMQEVLQVLRDRLGMRWEGERSAGRDEMIRAVEAGLNLSHSEARDAVDGLINSGEITYNVSESVVDTDVTDTPVSIPEAGVVGTPAMGSEPTLGMSQNMLRVGYWRLGHDSGESTDTAPVAGRAGQIDPTA